MDTTKLDYFKEKLLAEKERVTQELEDLGSKDKTSLDATYPESGSNSDDDNAAEISEYADIVSIEARLQSELKDVEKALSSIEKGEYGICKYCHKEIDDKRLEARPASTSCIECKKVLTQEM